MKQHGDGLKHLEAMTIKYGEEMLQKMEEYRGKGEPFDPAELLIMTVSSIMMTLIYGRVTEEDIRNHVYLGKQEFEIFQPNGAYLMLDILPVSRFILPFVKKAHSVLKEVIGIYATLYDNIAVERRKLYKHPEVEYFIDHFLKLSITNKNEEKSRIVDELDIRSIGASMFNAGFMTTSNTMKMMLAVLVNHPEIQDRAYEEIDEVIGKRNPTMEDRQSMPFTDALILETLRYHSVVMLGVPHQARCDAELNGFFIPKGMLMG